ncbi:DUF6527 family protein [Burkholderia gladioli]|uniref:DUF6527 family protein n=1 Tax=Burkholderia gladioli TaxID=28095 RepID=UPI003C7B748E
MLKLLPRLYNHLLRFVDGLFGRYTVVVVDDLPDDVQKRKLYAVGEDGQYWLAVLKCPCGCGEIIQLPMIDGQRPKWTLTHRQERLPNLSPSVDRTVGCRAHFWLKAGSIHWCK